MNNKIEITEGAQNYIAGLIEKDKSNNDSNTLTPFYSGTIEYVYIVSGS